MLHRAILLFLLSLCSPVLPAQVLTDQQTLIITPAAVTEFRQISVRILAAYKHQPRYIGSTSRWHLFLKKEQRHGAGNKHFSTIFGYRIERNRYPMANHWTLELPSTEIDPDNCPDIAVFSADRQSLSLPSDTHLKNRCLMTPQQ